MRIEFFSPSYKRPYKSITQATYPFITLVVARSEAKEYKKNGNRILICPDKVQGNLCRVRNWILDYSKKNKIDCTIIVDDDCKGIGRWVEQENVMLSSEDLLEFAEAATIMAKDAGVKLWGMNPGNPTDKGCFMEHTPFSFVQYIGGCFQAHVNTPLRFDEKLSLKEDYDFTLQNLLYFRRVLRFNAYHYFVEQAKQAGGCAVYRTTEEEARQFTLLQEKWGSKIVQRDRRSKKGMDLNPILKTPIKGV